MEQTLIDYPFLGPPSGVGIAEWFFDREVKPYPVAHRYSHVQGAEGFDLWRDGDDYCYLWVESFVDHDLEVFYLLDIRTKVDNEDETRDHLFVASGVGRKIICEWENKPICFRAPASDHRDRFYDSMRWFNNRIEGTKDQWRGPQIASGND